MARGNSGVTVMDSASSPCAAPASSGRGAALPVSALHTDMEPHDASLDEVRQLVAERQRFDGWLAALEQRRQDTPARVFARVHEDYRARRAEVLTALQAHLGGLEQTAHRVAEQLALLESSSAELEEERVEAHLRTLVGELDASRWEAMQHELDGRLAQLADDRAELAERLTEARELLAQGRGEPSTLPSAAAVSGSPSVGVAPPVGAERGVPGEASLDAVPRPPVLLPSLAALSPLADGVGEAAERVSEEEFDRVLARLDEAPPAPTSTPAAREGSPLAAAEAAVTPAGFDELAFVRAIVDQSPPDARKTLRCAECGAPNLPTEWYCERCGGELAAE